MNHIFDRKLEFHDSSMLSSISYDVNFGKAHNHYPMIVKFNTGDEYEYDVNILSYDRWITSFATTDSPGKLMVEFKKVCSNYRKVIKQ